MSQNGRGAGTEAVYASGYGRVVDFGARDLRVTDRATAT